MTSPEEWDRFFAKLAERGNITEACQTSGVGRTTVYEHIALGKAKDAAVEAKVWLSRFDGAKITAMDRLESEAFRRAHDGVDEPLIGRVGKDQDGVITTVKRYSDGLLQFLLKAHRPEVYKDRVAQEVSGPGGGPVQTETKIIAVPAIPDGSPE
jgi:hypothetical protein